MYDFLNEQKARSEISDFCSTQNIQWKFIPEQTPHFGGLWEAAVKSMKFHIKRVIGDIKLSFEELTTVLTQIESCLNSRPLTSLPAHDDDGIEALTPGHFLIGQPLDIYSRFLFLTSLTFSTQTLGSMPIGCSPFLEKMVK